MKRIVLVGGMMCPNCVKHVKKALEALGLTADVDLAGNCAVIEGDATEEAIKAAIEDAGYEFNGIK